jgi:carbon storage regulator
MLVLSRKPSQSIFINGDIRVTLVSIRGSQVRIGIEAPASMAIMREELCEPARASQCTARTATGATTARPDVPGSSNALKTREGSPRL